MLTAPVEAIICASDLDRSAAFLALFGFERGASGELPAAAAAALYRLDGPARELVLAMPGCDRGRVRLVETGGAARSYAPFDPRPFAIDLFTRNMEVSVAAARSGGHHVSPVTDHRFGPVIIREAEVTGPDRLVITLLESPAGRKPSLLDADAGAVHSEVHAFVWSAFDIDRLLGYWNDAGLATVTDAVLDTPGLGALVGAPGEEVRMRLTVLADAKSRPIRLEIVEFLGKTGRSQPGFPLAAGLHAPGFEVDDVERALAALAPLAPAAAGAVIELDTRVHPGARAVAVEGPGGMRFELWERR